MSCRASTIQTAQKPCHGRRKQKFFASFFQKRRVFFSEEKAAPAQREAKDFLFF
jgi:hypothetical protein